MRISDVIFSWRRAERWTRVLFLLFSIVFHIFFAYYFYTARFDIREIKTKKTIIVVHPVAKEELVFPTLKEPPQKTPSPAEQRSKGTIGPIEVKKGQVTAGKQSMPIKPGKGPAPAGGRERFKAPFNPSDYLKPETLDEIFRRVEREKILPGLPTVPTDSPVGEPGGAGSDIVIDTEGQAYFQGQGYDLTPWAQQVVKRINENWLIPAEMLPGSEANCEVGIAVTVTKNGQVKTTKIKKASEQEFLNRAALSALDISVPFPALSRFYPNETLEAYFLFNYRFPYRLTPQTDKDQFLAQKTGSDALISKMGLVKGDLFKDLVRPEHLVLGVDMTQDVYYRLMYKEEAVAVGTLQKGFNSIKIPTAGLFKKSGAHHYALDLKTGDLVHKQAFVLDIQCYFPDDFEQEQKKDKVLKEEELPSTGYGLTLFISSRALAYHKKSVRYRPLVNMERIRKGDVELFARRPEDPVQFMDQHQPQTGVPVLPLAFLAYKHLVKPAFKKKGKPGDVRKVETFDRVTGTFLVKDSKGIEKPIDVVVVIEIASGGQEPF
jgi:hypothetical protein